MEECEVETAQDGFAALEKLRVMSRLPELIFLDLNMPVMSGREFISCIKNEKSPLAAIPVIVMTAVPNAQVPGARGLISKPMEISEIIEKLDEIRLPAETEMLSG